MTTLNGYAGKTENLMRTETVIAAELEYNPENGDEFKKIKHA